MKIAITFVLFFLSFQLTKAQTLTVDKDKLFEYYQNQRYAEAAQYLQSIYPADTKDIKAISQLAYCYLMAGKLTDAERQYVKIDSLQPRSLPTLFNLASINSKRGNRLKTATYLQQIIQLDSNNFNAYKQLSAYTNDIKLKNSYLQKANKLNPFDADVAIDLAQVHVGQEQYLPAYQVLNVAIDADTSNYILQEAQLPVANRLKKYKEVVAMGEKLLANGGEASIIKDLGKAYFFLKNYQKTIQLYKRLEQADMQNEGTLYYTTLSYRELKNYDMAATYAKKTIDEAISQNTESYYALLGDIYESGQQLQRSATAYKKGLTFKINPTTYYRLGLLNDLKLKNKTSALTYYKLYLNSKPSEAEEKEQIDYVKSRLIELKK
jgi:thioredoxin-like negative regulator of GroEL